MSISGEKLAAGMARHLSNNQVPEDVVANIANAFDAKDEKFAPMGADICTLGICTDHILDDRADLVKFIEEISNMGDIGGIQIFPKGIIAPDRFLAQVDHIAGR